YSAARHADGKVGLQFDEPHSVRVARREPDHAAIEPVRRAEFVDQVDLASGRRQRSQLLDHAYAVAKLQVAVAGEHIDVAPTVAATVPSAQSIQLPELGRLGVRVDGARPHAREPNQPGELAGTRP